MPKPEELIMIIIAVIGTVFATTSGYHQGKKKAYLEAIKAGAAQWSPDVQGEPIIEWTKKN